MLYKTVWCPRGDSFTLRRERLSRFRSDKSHFSELDSRPSILFSSGAQEGTRTPIPCGTGFWNLRVYQFHHLGTRRSIILFLYSQVFILWWVSMKTLLLASALATTSVTPVESSATESVANTTSLQVHQILPATMSLDNEWVQITIILGCLLLLSWLGSVAYDQYTKRTPPEKRISARVWKRLRETTKES